MNTTAERIEDTARIRRLTEFASDAAPWPTIGPTSTCAD